MAGAGRDRFSSQSKLKAQALYWLANPVRAHGRLAIGGLLGTARPRNVHGASHALRTKHLPRLPILGAHSQSRQQHERLPDVRSAGAFTYTTSGRAAIALGLAALGIGRGDRVLVPTYHCPTMVAPVTRLGATPLFFPINADGLPDLDWLRAQGQGSAAILVPHYFGIPHDLTAVRAYCDEFHIALIEDCAHSFFGMAGPRTIGCWGDLTTASLTKFFPGPDGGVLVLRTPRAGNVSVGPQPMLAEIRAWLDMLEMSARYSGLGVASVPVDVLFRAKAAMRRTPQRAEDDIAITDPQAIMACLDEKQLPRRASAAVRWVVKTSDLHRIIDRRQENYRTLVNAVAGATGIEPAFPLLPQSAVPYVCPLLVVNADLVYGQLRRAGIPVFRWDVLWPGTPVIEPDVGIAWSRNLLQVACHQDLSRTDMLHIAAEIKRLSAAARSSEERHPLEASAGNGEKHVEQ